MSGIYVRMSATSGRMILSLWPNRVVNELNIDGIPSRQQLFDRSFKRLPLLSTIHVCCGQ
jgi:hypothetical protein